MSSPFVRRQRLAVQLRTLREEREMTADELAKLIHYSRTKISRLENAYGRPDVGDVVPQAAFSLYTFPEPDDFPMVVVETSSTDLPYTGSREVEQHVKRYELLSTVVLSSEDSLKCLTEAADRLARKATGAG